MYKIIKTRLSGLTKLRDIQLEKNQVFFLDAVEPLTHILEEEAKGQLLIETAQSVLKLLGNASAQASRERKSIIPNMNTRPVDMVEEDAN